MRQLKITQQITVRDTQSLNKYLSEISALQSGGLTAEEECNIAEEIQNPKTTPERKKELVEKLTNSNLRFVVSVAKQYQFKGNVTLELNDLINMGNLGLIKAAERFDHTRGFKFISYAVWWVRQSILQGANDNHATVRMPMNKVSLKQKINQVSAALEQHLERKPTDEEIAIAIAKQDEKREHLTAQDVAEVSAKAQGSFSLDNYVQDQDSTLRFVDAMESSGFEDIQNALRNKDLRDELDRILATLSQDEQYVIRSFFGLDGREKTLEEISGDLKKTRERARQIKENALRKLKRNVGKTLLREYL